MNWAKDLVKLLKMAALDATGQAFSFVPKVVAAILLLGAGAIAIRIIARILRRSLETGKVEPTSRGLILSASRFGAWILLVAGVLWVLGLKTISAAVAGAAALAALALAQGAQGVTADILAGIFLVGDPRFAVGRRVTGSGVEGTIEEVTIRKTVIRGDDGTLHVVPNRVLDAAVYDVKP